MKPDKKIDAAKASAEYQKAAPPLLQAAKGNDEVMSQPPQRDASPAVESIPAVKAVPKETAQEIVHEVMLKTKAKDLIAGKPPKIPHEKATS